MKVLLKTDNREKYQNELWYYSAYNVFIDPTADSALQKVCTCSTVIGAKKVCEIQNKNMKLKQLLLQQV